MIAGPSSPPRPEMNMNIYMHTQGARLRKQCAEMALNDALRSLASKDKGVYIAIFGQCSNV